MKSLSHVRLFETPWTVAYQAPLSMGFSRQEDWSGMPLPSLLSRLVITFLPRSKHLLISWLQSPLAVILCGCESWTIKKAERQRIDAFELWCWGRLLRVPWTERRSNQSILKEIIPEYSLEELMLKLKLQYFGHLMRRVDSLEKTLMLGKIEGRKNSGRQEDEMAGWHHQLNGPEFVQIPGDGEGQETLACCSPANQPLHRRVIIVCQPLEQRLSGA